MTKVSICCNERVYCVHEKLCGSIMKPFDIDLLCFLQKTFFIDEKLRLQCLYNVTHAILKSIQV